MDDERHAGGCVCGAVRYEVRGAGHHLCNCYCNSCRRAAGAPALTYRASGRPADIDVTLATLDEAARFAPRMHVWVGDKLPWVSINDGLPQHPGSPGRGAP